MIYAEYEDGIIRDMQEEDIGAIHAENQSHGWHSDRSVYESYFFKQQQHTLLMFVAEYNGSFAGYTTLRPQAEEGPFANKGIPEIADFNVFMKYRRKGIGNKILAVAEQKAKDFGSAVSLGVGLHSGYGAAQRIYVKRGYIPDGSGVWYQNRPLEQYTNCCNDDDLVLYLSKPI